MSTKADYYKILQVDPDAEPEVIGAVYRRLAAKYHPDVNRSPDAERRMKDINQAYEVLSSPQKRAQYDRDRAATVVRPLRSAAPERAPRASAPTAATAPTARLHISPRRLSFHIVPGGSPPPATLEIGVTEGRTLIGEVRASQPWIELSTSRLFANSVAVQVRVKTDEIPSGPSHHGTITVDSYVYGTRSIPVDVYVAPKPRVVLQVSPDFLDFGEMRTWQACKVRTVRLTNVGKGVLTGKLLPRQTWLRVSQTEFSSDTLLEVVADASGLVPERVYKGEIQVTSNGGKAVIKAQLTVRQTFEAPQAPPTAVASDVCFLQERLAILRQQATLTEAQQAEQNLIAHLLRISKGGDVAEILERGINTAQGYDEALSRLTPRNGGRDGKSERDSASEGIGWRDAQGRLRNPEQALPILSDLLERLQMWEANKE
jgi:hypothetical protein